MRITRLKVEAFGPLRDWEPPELTGSAVIVHGPNESGKSSLFKLLVALLYGIYPAGRDHNPYSPWDGRELAGGGVFRLDDGQEVEVLRRLRSQPEGLLTWRGRDSAVALRNDTVPFARHVTRQIYEAIFALTLDDLRFPREQVWSELQDSLLGGLGAGVLRPGREVMAELEEEANRLWRPDRRGRPEERQLVDRIRQLRELVRQARETDARLREKMLASEEKGREFHRLEEETVTIKGSLRQANRLVPVKKKLKRVRDLLAAAGDVELYDHLPGDPGHRLEELRQALNEVDTAARAIREKQKRQLEIRDCVTEADRRLLAYVTEVRRWESETGRITADRDHLENLHTRLTGLAARLETEARELLSEPWDPRFAGCLRGLVLADLNARLIDFDRTRELELAARQRHEGLLARVAMGTVGRLSPAVVVLLALGLGLFVSGQLGDRGWLIWAGALLVVPGAAAIWSWFAGKRRQAREVSATEVERAARDLQEAGRAVETARCTVIQMLRGLPVAASRLERPDQGLLADLRALVSTLRDLDGVDKETKAVQDRVGQREAEVSRLAVQLGLDAGEALATIGAMGRALVVAGERQHDAAEAVKQLQDIEEELARLVERRRLLAAEQEALTRNLAELGGGDLDGGIVRLLGRREARRDALALRKELEREHPDLDELVAELEEIRVGDGGGLLFTDEDLVRLEERHEQNREQINRLTEEIATLRTEIKGLQEHVSLDVLEGEMESLEEERRALRRRRDRLMLLRALLVEADRRFREEHQPDVLRLAGGYLEKITGGRYDRLYLAEDPPGGQLRLRRRNGSFPLAVGEPLSRGTLDQVFLALRLALVEHLDAGQERLPLFLDEVLVNWDGIRREQGLRIIGEIAKTRQVFLFTCHRWLALELADALGSQVLTLPT